MTNNIAKNARFSGRHFGLLVSFCLIVATPIFVSTWYLFARAQDQFTSTFAFSVRSEEMGSAFDFLGGSINKIFEAITILSAGHLRTRDLGPLYVKCIDPLLNNSYNYV